MKLCDKVDFLKEVNYGADTFNRIIEELRINDNYNSNGIEGSTVTLTDTLEILNKTLKNTYKYHTTEIRDIQGFNKAFNYMIKCIPNKKLISVEWIKELHFNITQDTLGIEAGQYRQHDVGTPSGAIYSNWQDVEEEMIDLVKRYYRFEGKEHILERICNFKSDLISTHPFADGNGRTSRMVTNYLLMSNNYLPIIIQKEERLKYIAAMDEARRTGNSELLCGIVCNKLIHAYKELREGRITLDYMKKGKRTVF